MTETCIKLASLELHAEIRRAAVTSDRSVPIGAQAPDSRSYRPCLLLVPEQHKLRLTAGYGQGKSS